VTTYYLYYEDLKMAENTTYTLVKNSTGDGQRESHGYVTALTASTATDYVEFDTGFKPTYVSLDNVTDRIKIEWFEGMAADTCLKTAATGVRTLETTNQGITVTEKGFQVSQNATLAAVASSKVLAYRALG
jgi:hypothetical protein